HTRSKRDWSSDVCSSDLIFTFGKLTLGHVPDWKGTDIKPIPGVNFPKVNIVERQYAKVYDKFITLGPGVKEIGAKGNTWDASSRSEERRVGKGRTEQKGR